MVTATGTITSVASDTPEMIITPDGRITNGATTSWSSSFATGELANSNLPYQYAYENCRAGTIYYDGALRKVDLPEKLQRVSIYNAYGIPKANIKHSTRFINKTKEMFIDIEGECKNEELDFYHSINVSIPVDTNCYDGYEIEIADGLVYVVLFEKQNEKPEFRDRKVGYCERNQ